jgi:hypothetical protein
MMKQKHLALAQECKRLARESESMMFNPGLTAEQKSDFQDQAKAYWQMGMNWTQSALSAEEVRPTKFTGAPKGERKSTTEKRDFLNFVSAKIGTQKHAAIASEAVQSHASQVRKIWRAEGKNAEAKILSFLKNNGL